MQLWPASRARCTGTVFFLGLGAAVMQSPALHAQRATGRSPGAVIEGVVTDTALVALQDVAVTILGTSLLVRTGPNGRFLVSVERAGRYFLIARRVGFQPLSTELQVVVSDTLRLALSLERVVTELKAVTVEAPHLSPRMAEFEERRRLGVGQFMSQAEIEKRNSILATELLRTFTSVRLKGVGGSLGSPGYYAVSLREGGTPLKKQLKQVPGDSGFQGQCLMQVVVDGIAQYTPYNLDQLPPPMEIAGIEVYSGPATIPLQFKGFDRNCGVIMVWTREGR